ncbi:Glutamate receptor 2-like 2, partial [Homarus americanus]
EADLGLGPFGVSATRAEMVDFTRSILIDNLRIMGGLGHPEVDPWGFLLPLAPLVWVSILVTLAVVLVAVFLLSLCFLPQRHNRLEWFLDIFFSFIRVLFQQDAWVTGGWWWERLVLGAWMLMVLVLIRSYAGTLMSILAVRYIPQPFQSLRELLDDRSTTMIWEVGTVYMQYLQAVKTGIFSEVMASENDGRLKLVLTTEYLHMADTLVTEGRHALVIEDLTGKVIMADHFSLIGECNFYQSREVFLPVFLSMIGQKNHPLVPALNNRIKSVTEAGLYGYWMKHLSINSTRCIRPPTKITVNNSLSVANLWGMFVMLAGGHVLALVVLGIELLSL